MELDPQYNLVPQEMRSMSQIQLVVSIQHGVVMAGPHPAAQRREKGHLGSNLVRMGGGGGERGGKEWGMAQDHRGKGP